MRTFGMDKNCKPHLKMDNGEYAKEPSSLEDILDCLETTFCETNTNIEFATEEAAEEARDAELKMATFVHETGVYDGYPYDRALRIITKLKEALPKYKDYYLLLAGGKLFFAFGQALLTNDNYASDALDVLIPFTKDYLFEIYLTDRVAYQQLVRAYYMVMGLKFRYKELPFAKHAYKLTEIPGLVYKRFDHKEIDIDPFDPVPENMPKGIEKYLGCLSPDIFIIPACYIDLAIRLNNSGVNIKNIVKYDTLYKYLPVGTQALYENGNIYWAGLDAYEMINYRFHPKTVKAATNNCKPIIAEDTYSEKYYGIWYGLGYYLAETEGIFKLREKIAHAALEKPCIDGVSADMLDLIPKHSKEQRREENEARQTRNTIIKLFISAVALTGLYFLGKYIYKHPIMLLGGLIVLVTIVIPCLLPRAGITHTDGNAYTGGHYHDPQFKGNTPDDGPDYSCWSWKHLYFDSMLNNRK